MHPTRRRTCLGPLAAIWLCCGLLSQCASTAEPTAKSAWEAAIVRFEEADRQSPPPLGGIVFVGSSTIRLWNLAESFSDLELLNRGFGGSQLADSVHFCPRIVLKYRPRLVVLYAGDNDLAFGKTPEQVRDDLQAFLKLVRDALPETRVIYLSIKPSIARWRLYEAQQRANQLCTELLTHNPRAQFLDVGRVLLDEQGQPRAEYFVADGLHLSPAGYARWAELLRPHLQ